MPPLDDTHRLAQAQLQATVGDQVYALTGVSGERSQEVREQYASSWERIVSGGQRAAARIAAAYLAAYLPFVQPVDLDTALAPVIDNARNKRYSGLLRRWRLEDEGLEEPVARAEAGAYARNLAEIDMQSAQRAGLDAAAEATRMAVRWRKVAGPNACEWCKTIAGGPAPARYFSAASVPFHGKNRRGGGGTCKCGVAPEVVQERWSYGAWRVSVVSASDGEEERARIRTASAGEAPTGGAGGGGGGRRAGLVRFTAVDGAEESVYRRYVAGIRANPRAAFITEPTREELAEKAVWLADGDYAGVTVSRGGELGNLFSNPGAPKGAGNVAVGVAVDNGATWLNCYDGFLPGYYRRHGFVEIARLPFNPEFMPDGWDLETQGQPDIVFMAHGIPESSVERVSEWNDALKIVVKSLNLHSGGSA